MISSQQISALIAAQQQQLQILQRSLPSGQVPTPTLGESRYPPSYSYGYSGAPPGSGVSAAFGGAIGAVPVALGAAQAGAGLATMFGVNNAATSLLAPSFGMGAGATLLGAAVPGAALAGTAYVANNLQRGMQEFAGTQAILSQMRFANPAAATGRGFSTQQQLGMYRMMSQIDAADPFTSMGDVQTMLRGFNDMKMGQGLRDAQEFSDKFKKMTETVKEMAKAMGTSIEGAMQSFGEMRRAGFVSGADLRANTMSMMIAQGQGIDQGQFLGMQGNVASAFRARGMTGKYGARLAAGTATAIMGGVGRGVFSEEQLMDYFDASSAQEAAGSAAQIINPQLADFMMKGQGQAFLAAVAEKGPGGRFTGKISQQRMSEVLRSGNITDVLAQAGQAIQAGGKQTQLSFANSQTALANEFLSRDSAMKDVVTMMEQYAKRAGLEGEDGIKYMLKTMVGVDTHVADMMMKMAKDYDANAADARQRMAQEIGAQQIQQRMRLLTPSGIGRYLSGSLEDVGGSLRTGAATFSAGVQAYTQGALDFIGNVDRSPIAAFDIGTAARAASGPAIQIDQAQLAQAARHSSVLLGTMTATDYAQGIAPDRQRLLAEASKNPAVARMISAGLLGEERMSTVRDLVTTQGTRALGPSATRGDISKADVEFILSRTDEGRALLRKEAIGAGSADIAVSASKQIDTANLTPEQIAIAAALARSKTDLTAGANGLGFLKNRAIQMQKQGFYLNTGSSEELQQAVGTDLLADLRKRYGLSQDVGTVEDLVALSNMGASSFLGLRGGADLNALARAANEKELGASREEVTRAFGLLLPEFSDAGLSTELTKYVSSYAGGGAGQLGAFKALLTAAKGKLQGKETVGTLAELQSAATQYGKIGSYVQDLAALEKATGISAKDVESYYGATPELQASLKELLQGGLEIGEQQDIAAATLSGRLAASARAATGQSVQGQGDVNLEVLTNLKMLTEQNLKTSLILSGQIASPAEATKPGGVTPTR